MLFIKILSSVDRMNVHNAKNQMKRKQQQHKINQQLKAKAKQQQIKSIYPNCYIYIILSYLFTKKKNYQPKPLLEPPSS